MGRARDITTIMGSMRVTRSYFLTLLLICGCSGIVHQKGFDDVKLLVTERLDKTIEWNESGNHTDEAADRIHRILSDELSADTAVELALLNNSRLQATFAELGIAQADLVEAGRISNPVFDGELKLRGGRTVKTELSVTENILALAYLPLRKRIGEEAFELAKLSVAAAVLDLAADARRAFYSHQGDLQEIELRRSVLDATEAAYDLARRMHEAGNSTILQRDVERALFEQAKLDLSASEARAFESRERLNTLLGLWGPATGWAMRSRLPEVGRDAIPFDRIEATAIERSLDLGIAKRHVSLSSAKGSGTRGLVLLGDGDAGIAAEREDGEWFGGPALSLPIPFFDQGGAASYRAKTVVRQKEEILRDMAVSVRARVRGAYVRVESVRQQALYQRLVILPLRQRIVDETQKEYNAMLVGAFDLLRAKRDEIESGVLYVGTLRDYWISKSDLEQIQNGRLPAEGSLAPTTKEGPTREQLDH